MGAGRSGAATAARYPRAALIGTGHIGGSLLWALAERGVVGRVIGFDADAAAGARARDRGIVDEVAGSAEEAAKGAALCVVATPVRATPGVLGAIAGALPRGCLVVDVGSTKESVVAAAERALVEPGRFVGCHPMAGTERSGPDAADRALFRGRRVLLTPTASTEAAALEEARALWEAAGAEVMTIDPALHDRLLAVVSHLPHVAAFALAQAVGESLAAQPSLAAPAWQVAGTSFADGTRVAASDPVMWRDILLDNRDAILVETERMLAALSALRDAIRGGDGEALVSLVEKARAGRARVLGAEAGGSR